MHDFAKNGAAIDGAAQKTDRIRNGVCSGKQGRNHVQGMAVDEENGCIYFSFTTLLIKTDFEGNLLGSVTGLVGHLGCIAFSPADGMVYGSLEYKHDNIGRNLLAQNGAEVTDGFYIAVFDGSRITRPGMSAEADGVMTAAFLPEVLADYRGCGKNKAGETVLHKYGCSGIDGLCFAPPPGAPDGEPIVYVAYGVYGDPSRNDNDHQVLLCYRPEALKAAAEPLSQATPHKSSPGEPAQKYFVYTGNTDYGVQNLEYDPAYRALIMAVYAGQKPEFMNYDIYAADLAKPAVTVPLRGLDETGAALTLSGAQAAESDDIRGWRLPYGQYGVHRRRDGGYYLAEPAVIDGEQAAFVYKYRFDPIAGFTKEGKSPAI